MWMAAALATRAHAEQPSYFSTQAALSGNSTMALDRSGGSAWLNPAGLAGTSLSRIEASATAFVLQLRDYSRAVVTEFPSGRHLLDANSSDVQTIPSALVFARQLHPRVTGALGVFVTNVERHDIEGGLKTLEQYPNAPLPVEFLGRAKFTLTSQTYRVGPSFGVRVTPRFRIGFGVFVTYTTTQDSSAVTLDGVEVDGTEQPSRVYLSSVSQRRNTWFGGQLIVGAQYNPIAGLHLGLTIRSPVLGFTSSGKILRSTAAITTGTAFPGKTFTFFQESPPRSAERLMLEPLEATFGVAYRFRRAAIGLELDLRAPLRVETFEIEDGLQWNARLGAQLDLPKRLQLGLGVFTDQSPKRRGYYPGDHRSDYYGFSVALAFDSVLELKPAPQPRSLVFLTVVSVRYAAGFTALSGIRYAPKDTSLAELAQLVPVEQRELFHLLSVQISSSLAF